MDLQKAQLYTALLLHSEKPGHHFNPMYDNISRLVLKTFFVDDICKLGFRGFASLHYWAHFYNDAIAGFLSHNQRTNDNGSITSGQAILDVHQKLLKAFTKTAAACLFRPTFDPLICSA